MNRLLLLLCVGLMVFSCKSKKAVVTKNPETSSKEIESKQKDANGASKVYADNTERYIDTHKGTAQVEMRLYGIPASITLAQGILESGSGRGRLALEANNHFGIKCHEWTGGKIYHDDDKKQECFRKYKDAKYSFRDHSLFLTERDRYSKLFKLHKKDYTGWATGLREAGYATDKLYPQKLIYIIERYRLYKLDEDVLAESSLQGKPSASDGSGVSRTETIVSNRSGVYTVAKGDTQYSISKKHNMSVRELQNLNGLTNTDLNVGQVLVVIPSTSNAHTINNTSSASNKILDKEVDGDIQIYKPKKNAPAVKENQSVNVSTSTTRSKVYTVLKGDTQYSISKKHNISVKQLQNLNGLSNTNLNVGQVLVVVPSAENTGDVKQNTVSSSTTSSASGETVHKVVKGDTQYSISKKYNLTVKELQSMNGLKNTNISIGQVLVVKPLKK